MNNKNKIWKFSVVVFGGLLLLTNSCKKDIIPILTTSAVQVITLNKASCGGIIISDSDITSRGVCWSTHTNPTVADRKTKDGLGTGSFTSVLEDLTANTTYFVRAYATNTEGTGYGDELIFKTYSSTITDIDGNIYYTVKIGTQEWMAENLKTTRYRNGNPIPNVTDNTQWRNLTIGAQCDYRNDASIGNIYGKLYNWYAVNDSRNIAPVGWHVPTSVEFTILENYLIDNGFNFDGTKTENKCAKAIASTVNWSRSTSDGAIGNYLAHNNTSGLTALPSGARDRNGMFVGLGDYSNWWSYSDKHSSGSGFEFELYYKIFNVNIYATPVQVGFSVRCIKD